MSKPTSCMSSGGVGGCVQTESKSKTEMTINRALVGPWSKHASLRFFRFRENERFTTQCENQNVDGLEIEKRTESTDSINISASY